jgi:hypothetical protein
MIETELMQFLLCVDQQETACMKFITRNRFHAPDFFCLFP